MVLEVRIPISPRPAWLNRVRLIARSVRQWYPDAIVTVSCWPAPDATPEYIPITATDWLQDGSTIQYDYLSDAQMAPWDGTRSEYLPTMMDRYRPPFRGDHILMLDADVIPVRRFDELFDAGAIQGVQAHHAPYGVVGWQFLFRGFGLWNPPLLYEYSGWGTMEKRVAERFGPFYPNSGVVFGPRRHFETLAAPFFAAIEFLRATVSDTYWFDQVGFTLGVARAGVPVWSLPLRYNFPNRPAFDEAHPDELADARFIHCMQTDVIDRDLDFESDEAMRRLVARTDLTGSNEALRARMEELIG